MYAFYFKNFILHVLFSGIFILFDTFHGILLYGFFYFAPFLCAI